MSKKDKAGTAVATVEQQETALSLPEGFDASLFEQDASKQSDIDTTDMAIPFLRVLQKGSPEVDKNNPKWVEGAEAGDFINTVTREIWAGKDGVYVIPISYTKSFTEWRPRKQGGGFVKDHGADGTPKSSCTRDPNTGRDVLPTGNEFVESALYYVFVVNPATGTKQMVAFTLSATQMKKSRQWNTLIKSIQEKGANGLFNPQPYYMVYRITTVFEKNDKGDWMGVRIETHGKTIELPYGAGTYMEARSQHDAVRSGKVQTRPVTEDAEILTEEDSEDLPF